MDRTRQVFATLKDSIQRQKRLEGIEPDLSARIPQKSSRIRRGTTRVRLSLLLYGLVEDDGIQIRAIGPGNGSDIRIHTDAAKVFWIAKEGEDPIEPNVPGKIEITLQTVIEFQTEQISI